MNRQRYQALMDLLDHIEGVAFREPDLRVSEYVRRARPELARKAHAIEGEREADRLWAELTG